MKDKKYISTKQYRILLSFALMLIFTTSSVPAFVCAAVQVLFFCILSAVVFSHISNKRICWGIFLMFAALMGEGMLFVSEYLPEAFSEAGFFLLPASTFLFLSIPMFDYFGEGKSISLSDMRSGLIYYASTGLIISTFREAFGRSSICGRYLEGLEKIQISFFSHTAGSALLVLFSLLLLYFFKNDGEEEPCVMETEEVRSRVFRPISLMKERRFIILCLCMLLYDILYGAVGIMVVFRVPSVLHRPAHIVLLSSFVSLVLLTLIVKGFRQTDTFDEYNYVPFLGVITTSLPLIFYMRDLLLPSDLSMPVKILWWSALTIGIWLFTVVVIAYARVINGRLLFGKQPRCLEGIPLIILHVLLALIVFMPWTEILVNI